MKLASYRAGRDGRLVVVARDLGGAVAVPWIAHTLQGALDDWAASAPRLEEVYAGLNAGERSDVLAFDPSACAAPLPRAYHWADASAYVNHVELVRRARGAPMPQRFWHEPLIYQGGSDDLLGAQDPIEWVDDEWGLDFEAEVAVVTDDVSMGTQAETALDHVRLLMLVNDVSLRGLIPGELEKGFGFYQSKPATAFSPVAVTPDELGDAWHGGKVHLPLRSYVNGELFGRPEAGVDMTFGFAELIAHAARTRNLGAGSILGSGTVSNKQRNEVGPGVDEGGAGYSCIVERRTIETLRDGTPATGFLTPGDRVTIEMISPTHGDIFGRIHQQVVGPSPSG